MKLNFWITLIFTWLFFSFSPVWAAENEVQQAVSEVPNQAVDTTETEKVEEKQQQESALGENLSGEELDNLIQLLNNSARIDELKQNLELLKKAETETEDLSEEEVVTTQIRKGLVNRVQEAFFESRKSFNYLFDSSTSIIPTKEITDANGELKEVSQTTEFFVYWLSFSSYILLAWFVLGKLLSYVHKFLLHTEWAKQKIPFLIRCIVRIFILALPIVIIYYSSGYLLKYFLSSDLTMMVRVETLIRPFLIILFLDAITKLVLAPQDASYRLVNFRRPVACWLLHKSHQLWVALFFFLVSYEISEILYKSGLHVIHTSVVITGFIYIIAFYGFILAMRRVVYIYYNVNRKESNWVWFYDWLVDFWHIPALFYAACVGFFWFLDMQNQKEWLFMNTVGMLIGFIFVLAIINFINYVTDRIQYVIDERARLNRKLRKQASSLGAFNRYISVILKFLTILTYIGIMLEVLGVPLKEWFATEKGESFINILISLTVIIVFWLFVREVLNAFMYRYLNATSEDGEYINKNSRLRTVLPLLKNIALILLAVILFLLALMSLGINTTPILAFSGVLGVAIGFGSQKLVSDFITGVFFLIEDTMQVGDVVEINSLSGTIEDLSIRTLNLRDLNGSVHTIPFGSIEQVSNLTKGFSYALMEIGIAYRENVDEVMEVLREIGIEMYDDSPWRYYITEELELLGVDSFGDNSVNIKCRFRTRADKKWAVKREFNRRVKNRFDELNIEIPFPHITLYFGEDKNGDAPAVNIQKKRNIKSLETKEETLEESEKNYPIIDSDVISED